MKLYVSGPMTGLSDYNYPAFAEAARRLRAAGHETIDPSEATVEPGSPWADYMRFDIKSVCEVDGVAVLPGWHNSRGAWLEVLVARELGLPIRTVDEWLTHDACECPPCLTSGLAVRRATA